MYKLWICYLLAIYNIYIVLFTVYDVMPLVFICVSLILVSYPEFEFPAALARASCICERKVQQ